MKLHVLHWTLQSNRMKIFMIGVASSIIFIALTTPNLTAQGLYYDEVHQAPAAFAYVGQQPAMFNALDLNGIPLLNMTYSGAIKSTIYGLYLKYSGASFTIWNWRFLGIGFVAIGVLLFGLISGRYTSTSAIIVFLLFLLSDVSLLLSTRHDWGPTALALAIRLLFIATWITRELNPRMRSQKTFILGLLVGMAIFEKLSSVVLVLPLLLILWSGRSGKDWVVGLLGLGVGSIPLIFANTWSYLNSTELISLTDMSGSDSSAPELVSLPIFGYRYLSLGQGKLLREWILGDHPGFTLPLIEAAIMLIVCLVIISASIHFWKSSRYLQMAGAMVGCYALVGLGLFLLPRSTWIHHWIIGTPFQYTAMTLAVIGATSLKAPPNRKQKFLHWFLVIATGAILLVRAPGLISTERLLFAGNSSSVYSPSFSEIAYFAASKSGEAIFVAADWGFATQIYSLSNGQPEMVYEPFKDSDHGENSIEEILKQTDKNELYLMTRQGRSPISPENTARVISIIEQSDIWRKVTVDPEIDKLNFVNIQKFIRTSSRK